MIKTRITPAVTGSTYTILDKVTQEFIDTQLSKASELPEGNNAENQLQDFIFVAKNIAQNYGNNRSFDFRDFLIYAEHLDTDRDILKNNFDAYVSFLKEKDLIKETFGCYSSSVFQYV
jgi:hypothetical protein